MLTERYWSAIFNPVCVKIHKLCVVCSAVRHHEKPSKSINLSLSVVSSLAKKWQNNRSIQQNNRLGREGALKGACQNSNCSRVLNSLAMQTWWWQGRCDMSCSMCVPVIQRWWCQKLLVLWRICFDSCVVLLLHPSYHQAELWHKIVQTEVWINVLYVYHRITSKLFDFSKLSVISRLDGGWIWLP